MPSCLPAAQLDATCARSTSGNDHFTYLFAEAVVMGLYASAVGGKQERPITQKALSIMQSIATDSHAPSMLRERSRHTIAGVRVLHPEWFSKP
jgi:hypothetical protein